MDEQVEGEREKRRNKALTQVEIYDGYFFFL